VLALRIERYIEKVTMSSSNHTVMKMMESLPLDVQDRVAEHLRGTLMICKMKSMERILSANSLSLLQDVQNKKLLKGKRLHWTTTSYEVCCSSLLWVSIDG